MGGRRRPWSVFASAHRDVACEPSWRWESCDEWVSNTREGRRSSLFIAICPDRAGRVFQTGPAWLLCCCAVRNFER